MRKHVRLLAGAVSVLLAICIPSAFVYAEDPVEQGTSDTYEVNHSPEDTETGNSTKVQYRFYDDEVEVAIIAWHQWPGHPNNDAAIYSANHATIMPLSGTTDRSVEDIKDTQAKEVELKNFNSPNSKRGNLVVVAKAKPGFLITGLGSDKSLGNFYAIVADDYGNIVPISQVKNNYAGYDEVEQRAYNSLTQEQGKYQIIFNYQQYNKNDDIEFTINSKKAAIAVSTRSDKTSDVNIDDIITLTSTISPDPKEIKYTDKNKNQLWGKLSITLDENNITDTINGKTVDSNKSLVSNADGTYTRTVTYQVTPEDVKEGKINYSISASLGYKYTLHLLNDDVTTSASATGNASAEISIKSNEIQIQGASSQVPYDGKEHSESGAIINGEFPLKSGGSADITVNGVNYHVTGINITPAKGIDAGSYPSTIDITNAVVTSLNNDGQPVNVTNNFKFETKPGSLTITPASLSIGSVENSDYNGQDQKLEAVVTGNIDGSPKLVAGQDYDLSYSATDNDYTNAGTTVTVTATGKGNYKESSATTTYTILPRSLRVGTNSNSKIYDGKPLTAAGSIDGAVASDNLRLITTGSQTDVGSS